jgi:hypothetical protein
MRCGSSAAFYGNKMDAEVEKIPFMARFDASLCCYGLRSLWISPPKIIDAAKIKEIQEPIE